MKINLANGVLWGLYRLGAPTSLLHKFVLGQKAGRGLKLGLGSCIIANDVKIGKNLRIGKNTNIAVHRCEIGDNVTIGSNTTIRCRNLVLKNNARIDDHVMVYGTTTPNSGLELGNHAWVYSWCHVNTDEKVSIGARSAAGSHCLIFTHSSYLPVTHGYPVRIAPVEIGEDVWLPWHVFVLPGVRIGKGATVGAFSLVSSNVPDNTLAVGVPAKVIKDASEYRRKYSREEMEKLATAIIEQVVNSLVGGFRPQTLIFPDPRVAEKIDERTWKILDLEGTSYLVFLGETPALVGKYTKLSKDILFFTTRQCHEPAAGIVWGDLVTLQSSVARPTKKVLKEAWAQLSSFGIRFDWYSASSSEIADDPRKS